MRVNGYDRHDGMWERSKHSFVGGKAVPESLQLTDISVGQSERFGTTGVKVVLIFIPPHFHHSHVVLCAHNGALQYLIIDALVTTFEYASSKVMAEWRRDRFFPSFLFSFQFNMCFKSKVCFKNTHPRGHEAIEQIQTGRKKTIYPPTFCELLPLEWAMSPRVLGEGSLATRGACKCARCESMGQKAAGPHTARSASA